MTAEQRMTTYRNADGEPVAGEYEWVTEMDWWEESDIDQPCDVLKQEWVCQSTEVIHLTPTGWCEKHERCCWDEHDEKGGPL